MNDNSREMFKAVEINGGMYAKSCVDDCESVATSFQGKPPSNNKEIRVYPSPGEFPAPLAG